MYMNIKHDFINIFSEIINAIDINGKENTFILIESIINAIIDKYIVDYKLNKYDILFVFKGGTPMRSIFFNYKHIFENAYELENFFLRSDSDYELLINPNLPEFNRIYYHFSKIIYNTLTIAQMLIEENLSFFRDYREITAEMGERIIKNLNEILIKEKFMEAEVVGFSIGDIINYNYAPPNTLYGGMNFGENRVKYFPNATFKKNSLIDQVDNMMIFYSINYIIDKNDTTKMTINNGIDYIDTMRNIHNSFLLFRLFDAMTLYFKKNLEYYKCIVSIENTDIIIHRKNSYSLQKKYNNDISLLVNSYLLHIAQNNFIINFSFNSLSISGIIDDLTFILFDNSEYPWENVKYYKRTCRLLIFIIIQLFSTNKQMYISYIINYIENVNEQLKNILIQEINENSINNFIEKYYEMYSHISEQLEHNYELFDNLNIFSNLMVNIFNDIEINKNVNLSFNNTLQFGGKNLLENLLKIQKYQNKYLKYQKMKMK